MRRTTVILGLVVMLGLQLLLSGCAGTARGKDTSVYQYDASLSLGDTGESQADALIVIRYPAIADVDAVESYYRTYAANAIGGELSIAEQVQPATRQIAQSMIAKSSYYSMSLYRELSSQLPAGSVLLSPHIITGQGDNGVTSRPLLAAEEIPSVLTIDFNVYSYPDPAEMMDSPPLTFGDIVTPLFVVHSNRWLRPSTNGLLLASEELVGTAWRQSEEVARAQFDWAHGSTQAPGDRALDFITYLDLGPPNSPDLPRKGVGLARRDVIAVEEYPLEKIRMDGDLVGRLATDWSQDPFAEDFVKGAATRVLTALNRVDHDRATFFSRQQALARFDPELAGAFLQHTDNESVRARLALAEALITAEKRFVSAQSQSIYEGTYDGEYGQKMREMISAEYRVLDERRYLARMQNVTTALFVVALAGSIYASDPNSGSTSSSGLASSQSLSTALMLSSIWAMNSAIDTKAKSQTIGENFLAQMAPALDRQISVQLEWLQSKEEITARDFGEFRQKTLALYQSRTRSITGSSDLRCVFRHPGIDGVGRWFGTCFDGLASGIGYGLIRDDDGGTIEYAGEAHFGVASGTGAMIVTSPGKTGAIYYEGGFDNGLPSGTVWVEAPGREASVREFRNGRDVGKGNVKELERVRF